VRAPCTHSGTLGRMSKVIQIRDVPDDVHGALVDIAEVQGLSLSSYLRREVEHLANRALVVANNMAVIRETQAGIGTATDRALILSVLHEGRPD